MKQSNLLSILILFFSLLSVQSVVAAVDGDGYFQEGTTWYTTKYTSEFNLGYKSDPKNLDINLKYPSNYVSFEVFSQWGATEEGNRTISIHQLKNSAKEWENIYTTPKIDNDKWLPYNTDKISPEAIQIAFVRNKGTLQRWIRNIKVRMAPHTKLNTESLSFNTALTDPDGEVQTIDFYSFLTGSQGMKISIVDVKNNEGNTITIEGLSLSRTSVEANVLEKIGENKYSFTLKFKPKKIITNATCSIKIENLSAEVNPIIYIPVTLNSTLEVPKDLKCNAYGYTFAQLSWSAVNGAESYNIYDNGIKVENNITFNGTSATITGLEYGSNHSYRVTSVVGTAESNKSGAVTVNCPAYPQIQNVDFSNVKQNQVTVNWDPVTISPANHSFVRYHIHLWQPYASETEGTFIKAITTTGTSCNFTGLIDNTQYTAYVDVEYQYTLNGETKNVHEQRWSSASITTTSFVPSDPFDGVLMYKGAWYRVNLNSTINITSKELTFNLNYPCNKLKFTTSAGGGSVNNTIAVKEDGNQTYTTSAWLGTDGTKHFETTISTSTSNLSISRNSGTTSDVARLNIWNIGLNIVPHTKIATESENISFNTPITKTTSDEKTIQLQSVLTANNGLKFEIVEKKGDTYIPTTLSNDIITLYHSDTYKGQSFHIQSNNTLVKHKDTKDSRGEKIYNSGSWDVKVLFNPKGNIMNRSDIYVRITNEGAEINRVQYIRITLKSSLDTPENLNCNAYGYTYANLSWSKVEGATGYKIYDNNNYVATISDGNTTNTRINLPYAETNHSISISSIFSDSESDKSNPITFTSPVYPTTGDVTISNVTPNSFTVSWGKTNSTNANQPFNNYTIHVYEYDDEGKPIEPAMVYYTNNTSIEITGLKEDVTYDAFVGVLTTIGEEIIHPSSDENGTTYWRAQRTRTTLSGEQIKGVYWFKDKWWIADRNTIYDLCDESFKLDLNYPCKYMSYQMMCNWLSSNNTVAINTNDVFLTKHQNIPTTKYREFEINPLNTDVYKIEIYRGGDDISGAVGTALDMNLRNIMVEIAPHILLNETEDVVIDKTKTTPTLTPSASINFKEITIGQESNVNIDFKSFLASGNITATLSDNKNFKINNLTDGIVAQNNTLKQLGTNDHNVTVSFTPQEKTDDPDNRDYSATLTIKDNVNTVVINLSGKSKYRSVSIENKEIPDYYDETTYYSTITHTVTYSDADLADWLWISSPFDAEISIKHNDTGTELPLTWAGNKAPAACYLLKYYDTAERANGVVKPWKDVKTSDGKPTIEAGKGYILGVDPRTYKGDFTITYTSVNKEKNASNKNGYSSKTQNHQSESDPILSNIHLVGSGLFEKAVGVNINSSDNVYFAVRAEAGSSNYYNYYFQNSAPIAPYSSFFMQYAGEYTFTTSQTTRQNAPAAFNNENSTEYYQLNIASEKYTDKTMILMAHNGSEGYAVGQDFFYMTQQAAGGNIANQFYSLDGDNPLSFNHRKNENQTIALGGCVKYAGEYSISLESSNISAQSVVLYDIFTDTTVDLLSEEYNFTTEKGSLNGRFIVTFSFAPQTTTEIFTTTANQIIVSGNAQNCTIDNLLVGKQVMIFDIMGRLIYNEKTNNKTINISLPTGTYIVRQADNWAKFAIR